MAGRYRWGNSVGRMCGRFVTASPPEEIARYFGADVAPAVVDMAPNFNVAPTSDVMVVYEDGSTRALDAFHWGLVPSWAKDLKIGNRMINARAETVADKGAFKRSLAKRRCIVPVDGFYEWQRVEGSSGSRRPAKQPYFITRQDREPLAFAGLWAEWRGELGGEAVVVRSATIITTAANETMTPVHDRMPVILDRSDWGRWLDRDVTDAAAITPLLVPAPPSLLLLTPVSTQVNSVRNNGPELIEAVDPDVETGQATLL